jgi:hypothetical protein
VPGSLDVAVLSTGGGSALPFTVGQAFAQGQIPSGSSVLADIPNFQAVVKNRWSDGSVKFAILSGRTDLSANTWRTIGLSSGATPAASAAVSLTDFKATGASASVQFGSFGTASWSAGDWDSPVQNWVSGAEMSSWTYRKPIGSDPHLVAWLEVRAYKGGRVEVLPWIENGYLGVAAPTSKSATASFTLGGSQRFSQSLTLLNHQRAVLASGTTLTHWIGGDPQLTPRHNTAYLMATKLVPNYRTAAPSATSVLFSRLPTSYTPLAQASFPSGMGSPGYDLSIGLLPEWDAAYLSSGGDSRAYRAVLINGYAAGRYGTHYRDEATQRPLRFSSHPNLVLNGSGATGVSDTGTSSTNQTTPTPSGEAPPRFANSHHPSMGYMAYLLSGWHYFLEENQMLATLVYLKQNDTTRQAAKGIMETTTGANTTRGAAWAIRSIAQAATISPDGDALRSEFSASVSENISYYHSRYIATPNNPLGLVQPYSDYDPDVVWQSATWMEDFFTATFGYLKDLQAHSSSVQSKLDTFLAWKYRSIVGRLGASGADQFSFRYAAQYTAYYAPTNAANFSSGSGPWYASWGEVARAMAIPTSGNSGEPLEVGYPDEPTGYWGNLMPAISYAVDHGATGASAAWDRLVSASNFAPQLSGYANNPVWALKPRSK